MTPEESTPAPNQRGLPCRHGLPNQALAGQPGVRRGVGLQPAALVIDTDPAVRIVLATGGVLMGGFAYFDTLPETSVVHEGIEVHKRRRPPETTWRPTGGLHASEEPATGRGDRGTHMLGLVDTADPGSTAVHDHSCREPSRPAHGAVC